MPRLRLMIILCRIGESKMKKGFLYFRVLVRASLVSVALVSASLVSVAFVGVALVSVINGALAHSGKLNKDGCHYMQIAGEKPILHCHHSETVASYYADKNTGKIGWFRAQVLHVIDGDTFRVKAHIWLGHTVETNVRLRGIDTPELNRAACAAERKKGIASHQALIKLAGEEVILHAVTHDKYGDRILADVYNADLVNIGSLLVEQGHARPYDGKTARHDWC